MELSIVIPCYKSSAVIRNVINEIERELKNKKYEIILIDDGNTSDERENLTLIASQNTTTRLYSLPENMGQHHATHFGCLFTTGTFVCSMDDDGQHNPINILAMLEILKEKNYDIVYAEFDKNFEALWRYFVRKVFYFYAFASGKATNKKSSFRIWTKKLNDKLSSQIITNSLFDFKILALNPNIGYVSLRHRPSLISKSRYSFKNYIRYLIQIRA